MPRSRAQRRTRRTNARARRSKPAHSVSRAALCKGVALLIAKSRGTASEPSPPFTPLAARSVTFGSSAPKAERRNLKSPELTRRSVKARKAAFWSWRPSMRWPLPARRGRPPNSREARAMGPQLTTMSTSGTATPKARPREMAPLANPTTSASGTMPRISCSARRAKRSTAFSLAGVGKRDVTNSSTWASHVAALNVGALTGCALGFTTNAVDGARAAAAGLVEERGWPCTSPAARVGDGGRAPGRIAGGTYLLGFAAWAAFGLGADFPVRLGTSRGWSNA
mmetsp:Transcript_30831/g.89660  ORF Transcript_30831/g.89660 Transcript_30831/m.89660 type:complete len:281 (-) Transcript_30831:292-1134(-)